MERSIEEFIQNEIRLSKVLIAAGNKPEKSTIRETLEMNQFYYDCVLSEAIKSDHLKAKIYVISLILNTRKTLEKQLMDIREKNKKRFEETLVRWVYTRSDDQFEDLIKYVRRM